MIDLLGGCSGLARRVDENQRRFDLAMEFLKDLPWYVSATLRGDVIDCVITSKKELHSDPLAWVMNSPKDTYLMGLRLELRTKEEL